MILTFEVIASHLCAVPVSAMEALMEKAKM
jgi:hypothetical protein